MCERCLNRCLIKLFLLPFKNNISVPSSFNFRLIAFRKIIKTKKTKSPDFYVIKHLPIGRDTLSKVQGPKIVVILTIKVKCIQIIV